MSLDYETAAASATDIPRWAHDLAEFSDRLDDFTVAEGRMHLLRIRCSKLHEEAGEVEDALIAVEGSNPRKPRAVDTDELLKELMDVATAALGAVEHITGNAGHSAAMLAVHAEHLVKRIRPVTAPYRTGSADQGNES